MTDYISREAAKEEFYKVTGWKCAVAIMDDIPAADVREVKRGKWNKEETISPFMEDEFKCSVCGALPWWCGVTEEVLPRFCPNCGAEMEE